MARLLVDMSLSSEWIPPQRAAGHEVVHGAEAGDPRAPHAALVHWSLANGCAEFTHDRDFGTMLDLCGADGPNVLQVGRPSVLPGAIDRGALVVAAERRQRTGLRSHARRGPASVERCWSGRAAARPA